MRKSAAKGLFRSAVVAERLRATFGRPAAKVPVSFVWISGGAAVLLTGLVLCLGRMYYVQDARVTGTLITSSPRISVAANLNGELVELDVHEGSFVKAGERLGLIRRPRYTQSGESDDQQFTKALLGEKKELERKRALVKELAAARELALRQDHRASRVMLDSKRKHKALSDSELRHATDVLKRSQLLLAKGYIRARQLEQDQRQLQSAKYRVLQSAEGVAEGETAIAALEQQSEQTRIRARSDLADIELALRRNERALLEHRRSTEQLLYSPIDGQVVALAVRRGEALRVGQSLFAIKPGNAIYQALVQVDDQVARALQINTPVTLRVLAYPHQHYGTVDGQVASIALAPLPGKQRNQWRVLVHIESRADFSLAAGMQVEANLQLERRSVATWLVGPLLKRLRQS